MPYASSSTRKKPKNRRKIDIHQNSWPEGYVSKFANSRRSQKSVSDATNWELVQDNIWRQRPPLVRYGTQPANPVVGRGGYRYNGLRVELFMLNVAGVGKIYSRTDGGAMVLIGGLNSYAVDVWSGFVQAKSRVYVFNGTNNLSFINLATNETVEYTALATPAAATATASANLISGTKPHKYYYQWTANNAVGESAASTVSAAVEVNDIRDNWSSESSVAKTVTVSGTLVLGATSYTLYGGIDPNSLFEIITIANPTTLQYVDDGSLTLNPFKTAPSSNSTQGPPFTWMYVDKRNSQVYGVTADNKLYYSAAGGSNALAADFSALNGGGYTTIDEGGDTILNFVDGFRTGKGDPVVTTSSRGAAGKGGLNHITFEQANYGDQIIFYPNVIEANGQAGTYAPRATVKSRDDLVYPTGDNIKSSGTSENIVNILTTKSLGEMIVPDINKINLAALDKAAAAEYQDVVYMCLPVGADENNEIWQLHRDRKNAWALRWPIAAKDIWLYEDNTGASHLCVLVNNVILEFKRAGAVPHTDDGVAWRARLAYSSLVWDEDGISLGNIHNQYFKLLQPTGQILANTYGLSKRGSTTNTGSDTFSAEVSFTGIGDWDYSGNYMYGDDVGAVDVFAQSVAVLRVRPKGLLNEESWEVVSETAGTDCYLSAVSTRGMANIDLTYQGITR